MILSQFMTNRQLATARTLGDIAFKASGVSDDKLLSDAGRNFLKSREVFYRELVRVGYVLENRE